MNNQEIETSRAPVLLLAEDSPADQLALKRAVEDSSVNIRLLVVENGEQALDLLRGNPPFDDREHFPMPNLILMDINMPVMDGKATLEQIRTDACLRNLPVIIFTTSDAPHDVEESYAAGANAYITKPVYEESLVEIVQNLETFWFELSTLPRISL